MPIGSLLAAAGGLVLVAAANAPAWLDYSSRIGVVALLFFAGFALHRKWWVPGWVHRDLEARHERLRLRYDAAIDIALNTSRGVERSANVLEQALARATSNDERQV